MAYLFRFLWSGFLFVSTSSAGRKRIKAQVNVKYHKDDVVSRTKFQLSCDAEGETSGTWGGCSADETQPATSDHGSDDFFCSNVQIGSEGEEEEDTLHYQRLRRAEEAWSKVREGALLTTLQNEASLMGTQCLFCASEATSRCLDCGPSMSLCESCVVEKHRTVHIFHNVEILKVRNLSYRVNTCSTFAFPFRPFASYNSISLILASALIKFSCSII